MSRMELHMMTVSPGSVSTFRFLPVHKRPAVAMG
eukprot:CAMPEP_0171109888 /NCGR_PEP_ID=MMETSP0766_2-20121228/71039_1 /TAXON_ID=439317 /ORGANISM="Gambierdiscus australes, Strain CAWD 149" /LENGTH=33 /DNA_ID= /DNA_START= /DNA_END= /DNA_ORIENTATION=